MRDNGINFNDLYDKLRPKNEQYFSLRSFFKHFPYLVFGFVFLVLFQVSAWGNERVPANYAVDEDLIVVPQKSRPMNFVEEVHLERKQEFEQVKTTVEIWQRNQELAEAYGVENSTQFRVATQEQRQNLIEGRYLRFLNQKVERYNNNMVQDIVSGWTVDDEINAIDDLNENDGYIIYSSRSKKEMQAKSEAAKQRSKKEKKLFRFDIQPRVEVGAVRVFFDSPYINLKAWIAANGNHELTLNRRFNYTQTRALLNYFVEQDRVLAAIDQPINSLGVHLRMTHERTDMSNESRVPASEINTVQLRYRLTF
jgi:hypothetical protein